MEQRGGADEVRASLYHGAMGKLSVLQVLDAGEPPVDQAGVGQRPEMLSGLQLRGLRRQKEQMNVLGHPQVHIGVPAGSVEHEDHLFGRTGADLAGERREFHVAVRDRDCSGQMEEGVT